MLKNLKQANWKNLPGLDAQLLMAPPTRKTDVENYINETIYQESSVLILLFKYNQEWCTLLIKRATDGTLHSGQMALPGGRFEKSDITLDKTAVRETYEEIGIAERYIEIVGQLSPMYIPVSGHKVIPYVGFVENMPELQLNKSEVEKTFIVPIKDLQNKENIKIDKVKVRNGELKVPFYFVQNQIVWGATAMIFSEFLVFLEKNGIMTE
jgi:8-oxo-dGTP pyrophosphatase MutT (NUDIX family)